MSILLDLEPVFLVKALYFKNRILVCQYQSSSINVYYPGASKRMDPPAVQCFVLVKAYNKPRPVCTHYMVAADVRIHSSSVSSLEKPIWCGITTIYNNLLFKRILELVVL